MPATLATAEEAPTFDEATPEHDEVTDVRAVEALARAASDEPTVEAEAEPVLAVDAPASSSPPATAERPAAVVPLALDGATWLFGGFHADVEGVFVATHDPLPVGTEADVVLVLPDGAHVSAHGRVVLAKQPTEDDHHGEGWPGYGLRFVEVQGAGQDALDALARRRPPLFYPD